ncbi:MAG TPA: hypothetical protein PLL30_11915 [Candidatus Krumholzibacteria bacterium]|nr:hypothetical protein [Candidatus Krumholzibacteria bacterium]HPD72473.1 hypothetical protein [Candidatus Krumholzibacteria bacterium]HRY40595.1 hypothetical protein [Candidatus Krumholzibacteria bacterium]
MDWHELNKHRVADLREMMKQHRPEVQGVMSMKKEQIVQLLAETLGIEPPHKVVEGIDKTAVKAKIRAHKDLRQKALEAGNHAQLRAERRKIHRLKRGLRRSMDLK